MMLSMMTGGYVGEYTALPIRFEASDFNLTFTWVL